MILILDYMVSIVLYGEKKDTDLACKICGALEKLGGVLRISKDSITDTPNKDIQYVLCEEDEWKEIRLGRGVLIFKSRLNKGQTKSLCLGENVVAVVEQEHQEALSLLKESGASALTCGMSSRNTLTLSSLNEKSAAVSLQRSLKTLGGEIIEPLEITVKMSRKMDEYSILALCAILLLSGKFNGSSIEM